MTVGPSHPRALAVLALACALGWLGAPASAGAHAGNPNFRSEIGSIEPATDGLEAEIVNYDDSVRITNGSDEVVTIMGYEGEPYVRISPDGLVEANTRSPAYFLNDDRFGDVTVPEQADAKAEPEWAVIDRTGQYAWHDHRVHYMSTSLPAQVTDESQRTKIFDYEVPIAVGGQAGTIDGTLYWVGQPGGFPILPFVILVAVAVIAIAVVVGLRRRRRAGSGSSDDDERTADAVSTPTPGGEEAW